MNWRPFVPMRIKYLWSIAALWAMTFYALVYRVPPARLCAAAVPALECASYAEFRRKVACGAYRVKHTLAFQGQRWR